MATNGKNLGTRRQAAARIAAIGALTAGCAAFGLAPGGGRSYEVTQRPARGLTAAESVFNPPALPDDPEHQARKHRYISINPKTNPDIDTVIKVQIAEMRRCQNAPKRACLVNSDCDDVCDDVAGDPPYYTRKCPPADCSLTVPPSTCIASGPCVDLAPTDPPLCWIVQHPQQDPTPGGCKKPDCPPYDPGEDNCCTDEDWMARLDTTVDQDDRGNNYDWSQVWEDLPLGLLHIGDCAIVPCVTYHVYACDPVYIDDCSDPLVVGTQVFPRNARPTVFPLFGDVSGRSQLPGPEFLPPDGYVGVDDLGALNLTVIHYGSMTLPQMHPTWADLYGPGIGIPPDYNLDDSDLNLFFIHAFGNSEPWVNTGGGLDPPDCPGAEVPCQGVPPSLGACCDWNSFTCQDDVVEGLCQGPSQEWTEAAPCAYLDPPCSPGACCIADACTEDTAKHVCEGQGGDWHMNATCGPDCNNNGVPDECEPDCNENGVVDECDIAAGTSPDENGNGIPDECELAVYLDIKPGSCPNPVNPRSGGVMPMAIVGSESFDVTQIDSDTLSLRRADGVGGVVTPLSGPPGPGITTGDGATPFAGDLCDCHGLGGDGIDDLLLKFSRRQLAEAFELRELPSGLSIMLTLSGSLLDGTAFAGSDCVVIPGNPARERPRGQRKRE